MQKKKLLAGALSLAMVATMLPVGATETVQAADTTSGTPDFTVRYGGDPSILVDGDTVYLYTGHDTSTQESYFIPEWDCYSSTDLKNWKFESTIMKADKETVTWTSSGTDAWAGQVAKHNGKYYFYYCTWDATSEGKQSIGVATSDTPTGPFTDIGHPLVKGTLTTDETSGWNDIDPTFWIENDSDGVEHRYLCWGNGKVFMCELNEDMTSVKDINEDGEITFGKQKTNHLFVDDDVVEMIAPNTYTEAPWLYRRKDANGNCYGNYYLFYAFGWREQMAYATIPGDTPLMEGQWTYGTDGENGHLMDPSVTSNTNHMAVFDFKGKTYFVYHNGGLPGGSGFRRVANIAEVHFNEDGSIQPIPETAAGPFGTTNVLYNSNGKLIAHDIFTNSSSDDAYPYVNVNVGGSDTATASDANAKWVLCDGVADPGKASYVSIQSEDKPGLYITVKTDGSVALSQNFKQGSEKTVAAKQTFKTVEGLNDSNGVSFESVSQPGRFLTSLGSGSLTTSDGSLKSNCTFYIDKMPSAVPVDESLGKTNSLKDLTVTGYDVTKNAADKTFAVTIPNDTTSVEVTPTLEDTKGFSMINGAMYKSGEKATIATTDEKNSAVVEIFAENGTSVESYTLNITKQAPAIASFDLTSSLVRKFQFEDKTDNAVAVTKAAPPAAVADAAYTYKEGPYGKAIYLDGTYGLDLGTGKELGDSYTVSYWMNPEELKSNVDPTFAAGTFDPQYWLNLTYDSARCIWTGNNPYTDVSGTFKYEAGTWQNVILTVSGTTGTLYLNGKNVASGTVLENVMTKENAKTYFGVNAWDNYYKGSVDDIMMFNTTVTDDQAYAIGHGMVNSDNLKYTAQTLASAPAVQTVSSDNTAMELASAKLTSVSTKEKVITKTPWCNPLIKPTYASSTNTDPDPTPGPTPAPVTKKNSTITLANKTVTYNGKAQAIGSATKNGSSGTITYNYYSDKACTKSVAASAVKNAGTYYVKATIVADASFNAATSNVATLTIKKAANTLKLSVTKKNYSLKKDLKKKKTFSIGAKKAQGKVSYTLSSKAKKAKIKVSSKGKVTVPKKCKKGSYTITVKAKGNANYNAKSLKVTIKVKK